MEGGKGKEHLFIKFKQLHSLCFGSTPKQYEESLMQRFCPQYKKDISDST